MADLMTDVASQALGERPDDPHTNLGGDPDATGSMAPELSVEERAILAELERQDHEVRTRDMAYLAAAGGLAGSFAVQYETGPDGRRYAVAADVNLDTSAAATPEQSLTKARALRAAAMSASGDASAATRANTMEAQARAELEAARDALERTLAGGVEPSLSGTDVEVEVALPKVELHVEGLETEA